MSDHIVTAFADELDELSAEILRMGGLAEAMISDACTALVKADIELARETIARDRMIDEIEADSERKIVSLLARRQPMAHDLRLVMSALKVSGELERIGDLSKNIAKRVSEVGDLDAPSTLKGIKRMGQSVARQLHNVLNAYSTNNADEAVEVWKADEDIDQHYNSLFREVLTYMIEDPRTISAGAHMLFIAKNLERIGDHCTNIAEFVYFQITGDYLTDQERPKVGEFGAN